MAKYIYNHPQIVIYIEDSKEPKKKKKNRKVRIQQDSCVGKEESMAFLHNFKNT